MKKNYKYIAICIFIANQCYGQLFPKAKAKLDSIYPNATLNGYWMKSEHDTTQDIGIKCNCLEFSGRMIIKFDIHGNILNKDMYVNSLKSLPDTIWSYIKNNISEINRIDNGYMIKSINNKGEIYYSIRMLKRSTNYYEATEGYILKFDNRGRLLSRQKEEEGTL